MLSKLGRFTHYIYNEDWLFFATKRRIARGCQPAPTVRRSPDTSSDLATPCVMYSSHSGRSAGSIAKDSDDDDYTSWVVPVDWIAARPESEAVPGTGLFSVPTTACKLRDERTIDVVSEAFGLKTTD